MYKQSLNKIEIWAVCEWRPAIAGVGAARLALLVGVDAMSISECHAMSWSMHDGMAWPMASMPIGIPASRISGTSLFL